MKTRCLATTFSLLFVSTIALADEEAPAPPALSPPPPPPAFAPATGFAVEGRMNFLGGVPSNDTDTLASFLLGHRGETVTLLAGPLFGHINQDRKGPKVTVLGADLRAEVTVLRAAERHLEAFVPIEATVSGKVADDAHTVSVSLMAGLGARYWLTPHLALLAEGGLSVRNDPNILYSYSSDGTYSVDQEGRTTHAEVASTLGLVLAF